MFKLTIETDNPAILAAVAQAVQNTPPVGWSEGRPKPPEVNVHASLKSMKDAKEAVNLADGATVAEEVIPDDLPVTTAGMKAATEKSKAGKANEAAKAHNANFDPEDSEERRKALRGLVVKVSKETDKTIKEATAAATKAAGLSSPAELGNCSAEAFGKAKAALGMILEESA